MDSHSTEMPEPSSPSTLSPITSQPVHTVSYALQLAVGGMTCVACSRAITDAVSEISGVTDIVVNQIGKSASAMIARKELAEEVRELIEDIGYECAIVSVVPLGTGQQNRERKTTRSIALEFRGFDSV